MQINVLKAAAPHVRAFLFSFPLSYWLAGLFLFPKKGHGFENGNVALSFLPFQSYGARLGYLGCLAMLSSPVPSRALRICRKVSDCTAPLDYGVLAVLRLLDMMILRFERKSIPAEEAGSRVAFIWATTPKEAWRFHAVVVARSLALGFDLS